MNGPSQTEAETKSDVVMSPEEEQEQMLKAVHQSKAAIQPSMMHANLSLPVEFYFADSNLPYDRYDILGVFSLVQHLMGKKFGFRFMWSLHTANEGHWVPITTVASFKRMRDYKSRGTEWIVEALKSSEELEVDEAGLNVRRKKEVKEPKDQFSRSVYAVRPFCFVRARCIDVLGVQKGFGDDTPDLQEKLEEFFNKYGRTSAVRMRRMDGTKEFKVLSLFWFCLGYVKYISSSFTPQGSVFAEFAEFETVEKFLTADPKPSWGGKELLIMSK
jgi:lupus La protein